MAATRRASLNPPMNPSEVRAPALLLAVDGNAVQLHPMVDQAEAQLLGDPPLELLELLVDELDDVAGLDVDEMIVMGGVRRLIAGSAVAEIMAFQDPGFLEQPNRPVDGGDRDSRIDGGGARMERFDVGMVLGFRKHPGNDLALLGDPQPLLRAKRLDIDLPRHSVPTLGCELGSRNGRDGASFGAAHARQAKRA